MGSAKRGFSPEYPVSLMMHWRKGGHGGVCEAGFRDLRWHDYSIDAPLVEAIPWARKYLGRPLLFLVEAERPGLRAA
jgi:hypothetical protein